MPATQQFQFETIGAYAGMARKLSEIEQQNGELLKGNSQFLSQLRELEKENRSLKARIRELESIGTQ